MSATWTFEKMGEILKATVIGAWTPVKRPPALYGEIIQQARKTKSKGILLINDVRGAVSMEESLKIGQMGGEVKTLFAVAYIPKEFRTKKELKTLP